MNYHLQSPLQASQLTANGAQLSKQRVCLLDIGGMFIKGMVADIDASNLTVFTPIQESMNIVAIAQVKNNGIYGENLLEKQQIRNVLRKLLGDLQQQISGKITEVVICFSGATLHCKSHDFTDELPKKGYNRTEICQWLKDKACDYLNKYHQDYPTHQHSKSLDSKGGTETSYLLHLLPKAIYIDSKKCTDVLNAPHHHYHQGKKIQATVSMVSMKKHLADGLLQLFEDIGVTVNKIMATPYVNYLALREAMVLDKEVIMCHLGNRRLTVSYFEDDMLQNIQMVGIGSDNITKDIMEAFNIDWAMAEKLKCQYGFVLSDHLMTKTQHAHKKSKQQVKQKSQPDFVPEDMIALLPRIITPRVEEIFESVSDLIKDLPKTALVVLSGASTALPAIVTTARQYLHTRVLLPPQTMVSYSGDLQQTDRLAIWGMAYANHYQVMQKFHGMAGSFNHLSMVDYDDLLKNDIKSTSSLDKLSKNVQESPLSRV